MLQVIRDFIRPDVSIPWHFQVIDGTYIRETYLNTGKMVTLENTLSEDRLTFHHKAIWASQEDFESYRLDPICQEYFVARDSYNDANGITATPVVIEEISSLSTEEPSSTDTEEPSSTAP